MNVREQGNRGRAVWTLAAATAVLAVVASAAADVSASRTCRKTVAKTLQKLAKTGFKDAARTAIPWWFRISTRRSLR